MYLREVVQIALFVAAVAAVVAEPPTAYGPPSFRQIPNPNIVIREHNRQYQEQFPSRGYGSHPQYNARYPESYNNVAPQPFSFQYEVKDPQSGNDYGHHATSNGNQVKGEYYVLLPDGRRQIVTYVADDNGYNADVHYEGQAVIQHQGGYGGYPENQYSGYRGNNVGYRGNTGGYRSNNVGYRGNTGGYREDFGSYQGGFAGYRY